MLYLTLQQIVHVVCQQASCFFDGSRRFKIPNDLELPNREIDRFSHKHAHTVCSDAVAPLKWEYFLSI